MADEPGAHMIAEFGAEGKSLVCSKVAIADGREFDCKQCAQSFTKRVG